jgi:hypothetical protein
MRETVHTSTTSHQATAARKHSGAAERRRAAHAARRVGAPTVAVASERETRVAGAWQVRPFPSRNLLPLA